MTFYIFRSPCILSNFNRFKLNLFVSTKHLFSESLSRIWLVTRLRKPFSLVASSKRGISAARLISIHNLFIQQQVSETLKSGLTQNGEQQTNYRKSNCIWCAKTISTSACSVSKSSKVPNRISVVVSWKCVNVLNARISVLPVDCCLISLCRYGRVSFSKEIWL
jgi:hypothetical protein